MCLLCWNGANRIGSGWTHDAFAIAYHIRFRNGKARHDFSENISRWDIHLERQVILLDFSDTNLPIVIHSKG